MNHFFTRPAANAESSCASSRRAAAAVAPMQLNLETRVDCVPHSASRSDVYRAGSAMMNAWQRAVTKSVSRTYTYVLWSLIFHVNRIILKEIAPIIKKKIKSN